MTGIHSIQNRIEGKVCSNCRQWRSLVEYGSHRSVSDGLTCQCKTCRNAIQRMLGKRPDARQKNAAHMRRYRQTSNGRIACRKAGNNGRIKRPNQMSAGSAVAHAIVMGRLPRASSCQCADCGIQAEQHHHESYEKEHWLDVIPLCRQCHAIRHSRSTTGQSRRDEPVAVGRGHRTDIYSFPSLITSIPRLDVDIHRACAVGIG